MMSKVVLLSSPVEMLSISNTLWGPQSISPAQGEKHKAPFRQEGGMCALRQLALTLARIQRCQQHR